MLQLLIWLNIYFTGMNEILVKLIYHHEGKFIKGKYEGGKVTVVDEKFVLIYCLILICYHMY